MAAWLRLHCICVKGWRIGLTSQLPPVYILCSSFSTPFNPSTHFYLHFIFQSFFFYLLCRWYSHFLLCYEDFSLLLVFTIFILGPQGRGKIKKCSQNTILKQTGSYIFLLCQLFPVGFLRPPRMEWCLAKSTQWGPRLYTAAAKATTSRQVLKPQQSVWRLACGATAMYPRCVSVSPWVGEAGMSGGWVSSWEDSCKGWAK